MPLQALKPRQLLDIAFPVIQRIIFASYRRCQTRATARVCAGARAGACVRAYEGGVMSFQLKGNNGVTFSCSNWSWRPIWDYVDRVCGGDILSREDYTRGHYNDGHKIGALTCARMSERLDNAKESGAEMRYIAGFHETKDRMQDGNYLKRYELNADELHRFISFVANCGGFEIW